MDEVFFFSGSFGIIRPLVPERSRSWLSAHAWKACNPQRFAGSNPALSALFTSKRTPSGEGVPSLRFGVPNGGCHSPKGTMSNPVLSAMYTSKRTPSGEGVPVFLDNQPI